MFYYFLWLGQPDFGISHTKSFFREAICLCNKYILKMLIAEILRSLLLFYYYTIFLLCLKKRSDSFLDLQEGTKFSVMPKNYDLNCQEKKTIDLFLCGCGNHILLTTF